MYACHAVPDECGVGLPDFKRRLARRVRALRHQHGLRQDDLESFGLAWKTIQKIEHGNTDPKVSTLLKLCRAFNVTLTELLEEVQDPPGTK